MAAIEPYSPCPCGSGQKFKWCCHKVEAYAERAHRLYENHQVDPAIDVLREGLRKDPNNAWLLTREALYQLRAGRPEEATRALHKVLEKNPKHLGALNLLTRMTLESEGAPAGAAQLQQALTSSPPEARPALSTLVKIVVSYLAQEGEFPAALQHLRLAIKLGGDPEGALSQAIRGLESKSTIPAWLKNPDTLSPPPDTLASAPHARFDEALGWANEGLWASAASAFETLATDPVAGPLATRNAGFCRLWVADHAAAVASLRRYIKTLGSTAEAVDLEALCQLVEPVHPDDLVEHVQLIWPLRNRDALLAALNADPTIHFEGPEPLEPDNPDSPSVDYFALLDKPIVKTASSDLTVSMMPRVLGRALVGTDFAAIEGYDDGRLDRLSERFTTLARPAIPSAHPKTKVLEKVAAQPLALSWEWLYPENLDPEQQRRLTREQGEKVIREVWPTTLLQALRKRTPLQAAQAGDAEVPLRAAVFQLEQSRQDWTDSFDFAALRARLKIGPEPGIDLKEVPLEAVHAARLVLVQVDALDDNGLQALYLQARRFGNFSVIERAGRVLADRPEALASGNISSLTVFTDLATHAVARGRLDEALVWVTRGRKADAPAKQATNAPFWEMLEIRLKATIVRPEEWVPELAVILERYQSDDKATQMVVLSLLEMGLIQVTPHPDIPGEQILDSRPLSALLMEYGPKVTTASGKLGVSAAKPAIWTPGSETGSKGSSAIWTPGSSSQGDTGKKLIVPGR